MTYSNISNVAPKLTPSQIYGDAGLIYIRYHAQIESKPNGQKKISGSRPPFKGSEKQIKYKSGSGKCYSLFMGREFQQGRWSILLDFDNKADEESQSGLELVDKLKHGPIRRSQTEDSLRGAPLHLLRRRPAKGSDHIPHDDTVSGRCI